MTDSKKPVLESACDKRHRFIRYAGGVLCLALASLITVVTWSVDASHTAEKAAYVAEKAVGEVAGDLVTHAQVQEEHDKHIGQTLDRIQADISSIERSQTDILKAIVGE